MSTPVQFIPKLGTGVPIQPPVAAYLVDGAITLVAGGIAMLTQDAVGAYTLAAPAGDGAVLFIVATKARAHVVTIATADAGGGAGQDVLTFGGAINDGCTLVGYGGQWFISSTRNVTAG